MATNTEAIQDLRVQIALLGDRDTTHARDMARIGLAVDKLTDSLIHLNDTVAQLTTRAAVLESRVAEFQKTLEEKDRRRWAVYVALLGSFLTLAANIALTVWRK